MVSTEKELLEALLALELAVKNRRLGESEKGSDGEARLPARPKPDLRALLERVETAARALPPGTNGQLLHFLENKSYEKARLWLEGQRADQAVGGGRNE